MLQLYLVKVFCENCGHMAKIKISEGRPICSQECPICECESLRRFIPGSDGPANKSDAKQAIRKIESFIKGVFNSPGKEKKSRRNMGFPLD